MMHSSHDTTCINAEHSSISEAEPKGVLEPDSLAVQLCWCTCSSSRRRRSLGVQSTACLYDIYIPPYLSCTDAEAAVEGDGYRGAYKLSHPGRLQLFNADTHKGGQQRSNISGTLHTYNKCRHHAKQRGQFVNQVSHGHERCKLLEAMSGH